MQQKKKPDNITALNLIFGLPDFYLKLYFGLTLSTIASKKVSS